YIDLAQLADAEETTPDQAFERLERKFQGPVDPLRLVGLDRVPGSGWFSLGELRAMQKDPLLWSERLRLRQAEASRQYFAAEHLAKLRELQERIRAGQQDQLLEELGKALAERRDDKLRRFEAADRSGDANRANAIFYQIVRTTQDQERLQQI